MIIVLAHRHDLPARQLVARLRNRGTAAELMLSADLGRRGWCLMGDPATDRCALGSRVFANRELRGIVSRLVAVTPAELDAVHLEDRAYAAAEMHAFLLAWLHGLSCPVLNRPHPGCLAGQPWAPEQWMAAGARLGLAVRPISRGCSLREPEFPGPPGANGAARSAAGRLTDGLQPNVAADSAPSTEATQSSTVHVVAGRSFGASDEPYGRAARQLAEAAGMELLRVTFERNEAGAAPMLVGADPWVDVGAPWLADAIAKRCAS
jgi:hypothetical protein